MLNTAPRPAQAEPATTPREQQDELALKLAQKLAACAPRTGSFPLPDRLKQFTEFFQSAYYYFDEATKTQVSVSPVAEWLLDNFYILEQAIRQLEEDMPMNFYQRLPKTRDGRTRIYLLAWAITRREDNRLDIEQIKTFIQTFQNASPLRIGELWALPLMLRLTVMETLAEGLATITNLKWDAAPHPDLWQSIEAPAVTETMVINSILNLRLLGTQDWKTFFESTSVLEKTLRDDPTDVYNQMDFETRNHYRSIIEELSQGSLIDEVGIAFQAVQLAEAGSSSREKHVGYYLIGLRRETLEARINYQPQFFISVARSLQKNATRTYLGGIA